MLFPLSLSQQLPSSHYHLLLLTNRLLGSPRRQMPSAIEHYENFLLNNASTISTLESSLRSLTWFLPGRFKDAELASEACKCKTTFILRENSRSAMALLVSAGLNLMSLYHDTLLSRIARADPKFKPLLPPTPHSRYTRGWADKSARYKWAARALEVIRFVELLLEMGLRRRASNKTKWRGIVLLEFIKYVFSGHCRN